VRKPPVSQGLLHGGVGSVRGRLHDEINIGSRAKINDRRIRNQQLEYCPADEDKALPQLVSQRGGD
jgi:hypothetical protein